MTTLIAWYKSDGTCIGRCDAKCYNAEHEKCDCICGGANHGAGLCRAVEQSKEHVQMWAQQAMEENDEIHQVVLLPRPVQISLFDLIDMLDRESYYERSLEVGENDDA